MAWRAKENVPEGSLKYLFVYLKIRIFKCSYRIYICNICIHMYVYVHVYVYVNTVAFCRLIFQYLLL